MSESRPERISERLFEEFADKDYAHVYVDEFLNAWIATQIKVLREQRGWSQAQLAEKAEMKQGRVSRLEDVGYGSWSISTLKRLAQAFDLTLTVSFDSFSSKILEIERFSRAELERISRDEEIAARLEIASRLGMNDTIVDMLKWQKGRSQHGDETGGLGTSARNGRRDELTRNLGSTQGSFGASDQRNSAASAAVGGAM